MEGRETEEWASMRQCPKCSKDMELIHFCGDCFHEKVRRDKTRLSAMEEHFDSDGIADAGNGFHVASDDWLTKARKILGGGE